MSLAFITLIIITIINPLMRPVKKGEIKEIDIKVFQFKKKQKIQKV